MSAQLVGRQGHATRSEGRFWLMPFGGVLIERGRPPCPDSGMQAIDRAAFDQLMRLMPNLDPELVKKIMCVEVCSDGTN